MPELGDETRYEYGQWVWYYSFDSSADIFVPKRFKPTNHNYFHGEIFLSSEKVKARPKHCAATKDNLLKYVETNIVPKREWTQW